ncbi:MAG TPA: lamin tail domain-containing protein, partial [Roseiflexaceae bacterium]
MATASRFSHRAIPRLLIVLALALAAAAPLGRPRAATAAGVAADLFFSEYVEGTSNNKALEIFNGTGAPVDLAAGGYMVQMYLNGNTTPSLALPLNGTVVAGDVFVLARSTAAAAILAQADQTSTSTSWYNGDDAVVLRKGGAGGPILDVIGQIGFDPGAEWGAGLTSTADNTLRRKPSVLAGDTNGADAFDPAVEWDGFAVDTFGGLGSHTVSGGSAPIIPSCGGPLVTGVGTAATRDVSASDADGVVTQAAITAINPSPSGGSITLAPVSPAPSPGDALTATLNVSAAVPAGIYNTTITFKNSDAPAQQSAICLVQVAVGMSAPGLRIHDIQGARHTSPISGTLVIDVPGVVTAKRSNGFYMQDPEPDALDATSEGIFVYTTTAPTVVVSDSVQVSGKVVEFRPGGDATNLTTTEIDTGGDPSKVVTVGVAAPPPPTVIGAGGRLPPTQVIEDDAGGDAEASGVLFDPASDGLDFY